MPSTGKRFAAAVIALAAWAGLGVQLHATHALLGALPEALWAMARYFTVISNLLAALVFSGLALGRPAWASPRLLGGITAVMLLVGTVYHLLLQGLRDLSGGASLADDLMHSATPVLVAVYWLLLAPKGGLTGRDPWRWGALPAAYFAYALARGALDGIYPYPFLDVARHGWPRTLAAGLVMGMFFVIIGQALAWLDKALARLQARPA